MFEKRPTNHCGPQIQSLLTLFSGIVELAVSLAVAKINNKADGKPDT
jgi:hypothetical protein